MFFKQFYNDYLSQASYFIGCQRTGEAMIIDPIRDLTQYVALAEQEGFKITKAAETHIHADYASGIREVANRLDATIYVSKEGEDSLGYRNMPEHTVFVGHDDTIQVGNIELNVLHTPGHTPESISFLLTDFGGGATVPMGLFSGDFIFVGDVGRPDLLEKAVQIAGSTEKGAKQMYESIQMIKSYPDYIQIWPGHGAGSPCGKALGAIPMSTLGYEKVNNWAFKIEDEDTFIDMLTTDQPAPPKHFAEMKRINQFGTQAFRPYRVYLENDKTTQAFDLRSKEAYHGGHTLGSINVPYNKHFINQMGWYLDYDQDIQLIGDYETIKAAVQTLQLIGFDRVKSYKAPTFETVTTSIHSDEMTGEEQHVIDVRNDKEWEAGHLSQAHHIPHGQLLDTTINIDKTAPLYVHCQSGVRSSIAVGILERKGFQHIINVREGYQRMPDSIKQEIQNK